MIDLHTHILPGVDDGPATMDEALDLCRALVDDGVTAAVATPHMFSPIGGEPSREEVLAANRELTAAIAEAGIPLTIHPGAETHVFPDITAFLRDGKLITVNDQRRYLLVEMSMDMIPPAFDQLLFQVQLAGVIPIIAHPECNMEVQRNPDSLVPLVEAGAVMQITAASITGDFGNTIQRCAMSLLDRDLGHVVASDTHDVETRPPRLTAARSKLARRLDADRVHALFEGNPAAILAGDVLDLPPLRPKKQSWWRRLF